MKYDKLLDLAEAELGYLEKKTCEYLDDKTKNAGNKNYTKYARDVKPSKVQGYAWCQVFVLWLFQQTYGTDASEKMLYLDEWVPDWESWHLCDVESWWANLKDHGVTSKTPQVGDLIYFQKSSGQVKHVGIVRAVTDDTVYTYEGNTSDGSKVVANGGAVCKKSYSRSSSAIKGYAHPDWTAIKEEETEMVKIEMPICKKGDKCIEIRRAKQIMKARGWKGYKISQTFGGAFERQVKRFQAKFGLEQTGWLDAETWDKILH